jgi:murein DD-endopeptidase MepM/ murein hydrolase activator NlpD
MIGPIDKFDAQALIADRAGALAAKGDVATAAEKKKAAEDFVALLFMEVLKTMRASIPKGGLFDSDSVENDVYTSMGDTEIARAIAGREALGLRQMMEKALDHNMSRALDRSAPKPVDQSPATPLGFDIKPAESSLPRIPTKQESHAPNLEAPVDGRISSRFGFRPDPWSGKTRFHKGVDIAAPAGTPIKAAAAGKVVSSGWAEGYGNLVTIDHGDGSVTRYGHNSANLVQAGDAVAAGQEIALVGSTGRATGAHLHFEIERNGEAVDPVQITDFKGLMAKTDATGKND